ncbi:MAG: DUF2029 domain-containing protein [Chloroflexi bacterium]|nr:DUF2029 domain-containing protein [Chloroflexota bacterium]
MKIPFNRYWLLVGLLWLLFLAATFYLYVYHPNGGGDFSYYYRGIQRLLNGIPLYENLRSIDYVGPPLQIQLMSPLVALTPDQSSAERLWFAVNVIVLLVTLALLSRHVTQHHQRLILWTAPIFLVATYQSFLFGQITIILFALTVGAWAAYREQHPLLAGVLLATAVWTKFYPGLLLAYFMWKREWRVVFAGVATTLIIILLQAVISGTDTLLYYFTNVLPELAAEGQPYLNHSNNSVLGFAQKMFMDSPQVIPVLVSPTLLTITRYGLLLALMGGTLYLISRPTIPLAQTPEAKYDFEYSAVLLVALLGGSTLGLHGMLSALLPLVILFRSPYRLTPQVRLRLKLLSLIALILINMHLLLILGYLRPPSDMELPALALSLPFFGMMLLWGMVAFMLYRQRQTDAVLAPIAQAAASD